jgi:hypothetical protein
MASFFLLPSLDFIRLQVSKLPMSRNTKIFFKTNLMIRMDDLLLLNSFLILLTRFIGFTPMFIAHLPCFRLLCKDFGEKIVRRDLETCTTLSEDAPEKEEIFSDGSAVGRVQCHFLFAMIWSIGAVLDAPERHCFDAFLRSKCKESYSNARNPKGCRLDLPFPATGLVYNFYFEQYSPTADHPHKPLSAAMKVGRWKRWLGISVTGRQGHLSLPPTTQLSSIIVPTEEVAQISFLLQMALQWKQRSPASSEPGVNLHVRSTDSVALEDNDLKVNMQCVLIAQ